MVPDRSVAVVDLLTKAVLLRALPVDLPYGVSVDKTKERLLLREG